MLWLLACVSGDDGETATPVGDTGEIGWWYEPPADSATATWSQAEAEAAWQAVLDAPVPTCNDIIAGWLRVFALEPDATCLGTDPGGLNNDRGCLLADGSWVRGQTDYRYIETAETATFEHVVNLDVDIVWPDESGAAYQGACGVSGDSEMPGSRQSESQGTYRDPQDPGWFAQGMQGMWLASVNTLDDDRATIQLEGGIAYDGGTYVYFDDFSVDIDNCALGGAQLLDPSGYWWDLEFGVEGSPECEPCGDLSYAGVPVGESCLTWSGLVEQQADALWNQSPWLDETP